MDNAALTKKLQEKVTEVVDLKRTLSTERGHLEEREAQFRLQGEQSRKSDNERQRRTSVQNVLKRVPISSRRSCVKSRRS